MFELVRFWSLKRHPKVTCRKIKKFAYDYLEQQLDPAVAEEFERHLIGCKSCEQFIRTYRAVAHPEGLLTDLNLDPEFEERILQFLAKKRLS